MENLKAALHTGPPSGPVTLRGVAVYSVEYATLTTMDPTTFPADQAPANTNITIATIEHSYDGEVLRHPIENEHHAAALQTYFNMHYGIKHGVPIKDMHMTLDAKDDYMAAYCAHISVAILRYMNTNDMFAIAPLYFAVQASRIWAGAITDNGKQVDVVNICCSRKIYAVPEDHPAYMEFLKAAHEFATINHVNQLTIICRNDAARFAIGGGDDDLISSVIRIWTAAWKETRFPPLCDPANGSVETIMSLVTRLKHEIPHHELACIRGASGCQVHGRTCRKQKNKRYADVASDYHERQCAK